MKKKPHKRAKKRAAIKDKHSSELAAQLIARFDQIMQADPSAEKRRYASLLVRYMKRQARKDSSRFLAKHVAALWKSGYEREQCWKILEDRMKMRDEQFLIDFMKCLFGKLKCTPLTFTDLQQAAIATWVYRPWLSNQEMLEHLHEAGFKRTTLEHVRTLRHRLLLKRRVALQKSDPKLQL